MSNARDTRYSSQPLGIVTVFPATTALGAIAPRVTGVTVGIERDDKTQQKDGRYAVTRVTPVTHGIQSRDSSSRGSSAP